MGMVRRAVVPEGTVVAGDTASIVDIELDPGRAAAGDTEGTGPDPGRAAVVQPYL